MTSPRPFRPGDEDMPTTPYPFEASHPFEHLLRGERAKPTQRVTQRPAVTAGPVHIDEQPTMRMPNREFLEHVKAQRESWVLYHRDQAQKLRRQATEISESVADMISTCNRMDYRYTELCSWANLDKREAAEMFTLADRLPRIRSDIAHWQVKRMQLIERAKLHDGAIKQIQAEMAAMPGGR